MNWRNAAKASALLVSFIVLAFWLERETGKAINQLKLIPLYYMWWGLGIASSMALLAWLLKNAERRRQTARVYRSRWFWWLVVTLLLVVIGISAYGYYKVLIPYLFQEAGAPLPPSSLPLPTSDTTFVVVATPGKPAEVIMPPNWMIVWWGDKTRFESYAVWRGRDKIRLFKVRPGVGSVEIRVHRYYDSDPNWWRRQ